MRNIPYICTLICHWNEFIAQLIWMHNMYGMCSGKLSLIRIIIIIVSKCLDCLIWRHCMRRVVIAIQFNLSKNMLQMEWRNSWKRVGDAAFFPSVRSIFKVHGLENQQWARCIWFQMLRSMSIFLFARSNRSNR